MNRIACMYVVSYYQLPFNRKYLIWNFLLDFIANGERIHANLELDLIIHRILLLCQQSTDTHNIIVNQSYSINMQ